ncbi:hypothetical protein ACFFWA_29010 [Actinomadura verrucosospora]|uniref:hypothetical protein n=1 Tax=Actinomadura verrucosospora TaxID=46165 RepID=UPI0031ED6B11
MSSAAAINGTWKISVASGVDQVQLTLRGMLSGDRSFSSSLNLPLVTLPGLSREALTSEGTQIDFELPRDAGVLAFKGQVGQGRGDGSFALEASVEFLGGMQSLGYENLTGENLLTMASHDVNLAFVKELSALGYERIPVAQLVEMRIHGVTSEFVRELQALGYERRPLDQLIAMHIHGAGPDFIRQFRDLGYEQIPATQLLEMRIHGVTSEFVRELQAPGYERRPLDQLIAMRVHGAGPDPIPAQRL